MENKNTNIYYRDCNGNDTFPISFQQYTMVVMNTLCKIRNPLYEFIRITGNIDLKKLEKSIQNLYNSYDALRIRIFPKNDNLNIDLSRLDDVSNFANQCGYFQKVLSSYDYKLTVMPSNGENSSEQLAYAKSDFIRKITEYQSVIDTPLFDVVIYNVGNNDYLMCLLADHSISDGITMNILINNIFQYYNDNFNSSEQSKTKTFIEYVQQVNSIADTSYGIQNYNYWQTITKDITPLIIPPPNNTDFDLNSNGEIMISFEKNSIEKVARNNRTSINNIMTMSLFLGLAKYFKNNDICIGTAFSNRNNPEKRKIVGLLVSAFITRYTFNPNETFKEAIKSLMNVTEKNSRYCEGFQGDTTSGVNLCVTYISNYGNINFEIPNGKVEILSNECHDAVFKLDGRDFLYCVETLDKVYIINGFYPNHISATAIHDIMENTKMALNEIINNADGKPYDFIFNI